MHSRYDYNRNIMIELELEAEVVRIQPPTHEVDGWGATRRFAGFVEVKCKNGRRFSFIDHARNAIPINAVKVGDRGTCRLISNAYTAMPYFLPGWIRREEQDKRLAKGDVFAADAWENVQTGEVKYTVVGGSP